MIKAATDSLSVLAKEFGPAGAALLMLVFVMAYFYRRDFLVKQHGLTAAHARRDARDERLIKAIELLRESVSLQSTKLEHHHETEVAALDRIEQFALDASHDARNILNRLPVLRVAPVVPPAVP